MAILVFCLITLFMIAVIVYIVLVRRKDRSEKTSSGYGAFEMDWLGELFDKLNG